MSSGMAHAPRRWSQLLSTAFEARQGAYAHGSTAYLRLQDTLEIYRAMHGHYPQALIELYQSGLISAAGLSYPYSSRYVYERQPSGYRLVPPLD